MKLSELIDALHAVQEAADGDPEVYIAYQPQYPLYTKALDVTTPQQVYEHTDARIPALGAHDVLILSDYADVGFMSKEAWDVRD